MNHARIDGRKEACKMSVNVLAGTKDRPAICRRVVNEKERDSECAHLPSQAAVAAAVAFAAPAVADYLLYWAQSIESDGGNPTTRRRCFWQPPPHPSVLQTSASRDAAGRVKRQRKKCGGGGGGGGGGSELAHSHYTSALHAWME